MLHTSSRGSLADLAGDRASGNSLYHQHYKHQRLVVGGLAIGVASGVVRGVRRYVVRDEAEDFRVDAERFRRQNLPIAEVCASPASSKELGLVEGAALRSSESEELRHHDIDTYGYANEEEVDYVHDYDLLLDLRVLLLQDGAQVGRIVGYGVYSSCDVATTPKALKKNRKGLLHHFRIVHAPRKPLHNIGERHAPGHLVVYLLYFRCQASVVRIPGRLQGLNKRLAATLGFG